VEMLIQLLKLEFSLTKGQNYFGIWSETERERKLQTQ
jgi:hypothetical protein